MNNGEFQPIDEIPEFQPLLDEEMVQKAAAKKPEITHALRRLSVETQWRVWHTEQILEHDKALAYSQKVQEEILKELKELNAKADLQARALADQAKAQVETDRITRENQKTIQDWKTTFQSPIRLIGGLIVIVVTAAAGALLAKLWK